jgi:hypothetical protein
VPEGNLAMSVSGWRTIEPIRMVTEPSFGPMLCDIAGQLPAGSGMESSDLVEYGHEGTHAVNNRIRNEIGGGVNAFYVGQRQAMVLIEPAVRKSQVANSVPRDLVGQWFELYVAGQPAWDEQPLYILDELTAYINGAAVGHETNSDQGPYQLGVAFEFIGYAGTLLETVDLHDPRYVDRMLLVEYLNFCVVRVRALAPLLGYVPNLTTLQNLYGNQITALKAA